MLKCIVLFLFVQLVRVKCLADENYCNAEGQPGVCRPLGQCPGLLAEIKRTGTPFPPALKTKIVSLTCGSIGARRMVCCSSSASSMTDYPSHPSISYRGGREQTVEYSNNMRPGGSAKQTVEEDDNIGPKDIQNHPNLKLLPTECGDVDIDRIIGGQETSVFEMPWIVMITYNSERGPKYACGGTLINERYVLTAAHCVVYLPHNSYLDEVVLGEHDVETDPDCETDKDGVVECAPRSRNSSIEQVIAHPGFTYRTLRDDIALIRLAQPADFSLASMKPICLPLTNALQTESLADLNGEVAGWGFTENGLQSTVLLKVSLPIVSKEKCNDVYKGVVQIKNNQICAGAVKDKGSCRGDSGGPLMIPGTVGTSGSKTVQRGIVSFGPTNCNLTRVPGVYTNVAYYMDWILDHMRP